MEPLRIDPEFESLIPPLSDDEFKQLEENIVEAGMCYDPIITWDGVIIDGHNRWKIIQKHPEVSYKTYMEIFSDRNEAKLWIIRNQLGRRNLPDYEKARLALRLKDVIAAEAKAKEAERKSTNQKSDKSPLREINTNKELAKVAGVSHDTIHKVDVIEKKAPEEVKDQLRRGEVSINKAYNEIRAAEPPKSTEPPKSVEPPKPIEYTINDLVKEVESSGENYVKFLRDTLAMRNAVYVDSDSKKRVLDEIIKIKGRIEAIENLLK